MSDDARRVPGLSICLMTTSSMVPTISPGELMLIEPSPLNRLRPGDLLLVDRGEILKDVHRLIRRVRLGGVAHVVTKGDANMSWDPPVPSSRVAGRVVKIGRPKGRWLSIDGWRGWTANAAAAGGFLAADLLCPHAGRLDRLLASSLSRLLTPASGGSRWTRPLRRLILRLSLRSRADESSDPSPSRALNAAIAALWKRAAGL
jgi:hypothetical protein